MATLFSTHQTTELEAAIARIPILDLAPFFQREAGSLERLGDQLRQASEVIGFFYLSGHGIPQTLIDRAFAESKRFHALPLEQKSKLAIDMNNTGYMPMNASMQRHSQVHQNTRPNQNESLFVGYDRDPEDPDVKAGIPFKGTNRWPDDLPGFRDTIMEYFWALHGLGQSLAPILSVSLGLQPNYFGPFFGDEPNAKLRLLHYPPTTDAEDNAFGAAPHTDNGFLTFLAREPNAGGLSVRFPDGEWVPPPVVPGTFLVNLGNTLRRWTNDRFLATPHGVINDGSEDRYSIAYFHSVNPDTLIECLPTCRDEQRPARYEPIKYRDLIHEFYDANYFHRK